MPLRRNIYFAHSLRDYNTPKETSDEATIKRFFQRGTVNPNGKLEQRNWQAKAQALIQPCKAVVFTEWQGYIGKGVSFEIEFALEIGLPVYLLRGGQFYRITVENLQPPSDNWVFYRRVNVSRV